MNIIKKTVCLLVCSLLFTLGACSSGTTSEASVPVDPTRNIISYVSKESSVYSSTAEVVKAVADTVVEISTESITTRWGQQYIVSGAGSGVLVGAGNDNSYTIITNNHVISGANDITVNTREGTSYSASLIATDDQIDIAVLSIQTTDELQIATWGDSDQLQVGEDLIAIGNPLGSLGGTVTKGILSATSRQIAVSNYEMTLLQTDTAINPGNSGGGLFNMRGQLIGVVNAKTTDEEIEGICFAIPGNSAKKAYEDLVEYHYIVGRASLDVVVSSVSSNTTEYVYVASVGNNASSNFKQYDRIYKINGTEITSILQYNKILSSIKVGDTVSLEVNRGRVVQSMWGAELVFDKEVTSFEAVATQYGA